ncbi:MAG: HAD-IC family P-type ATPase, partial [Rhodocyclaceae bacterium]
MMPHSETLTAVKAALAAGDTGLSAQEAGARLAIHGPNQLPAPRRKSPLKRFALQFHNPLIYVLLAAAAVTFLLKNYVDGGVILGVVFINALIGFIQEGKAERALEAVRAMLASRAMVLRDGERREIDAAELVLGDIVLLEAGTRVPADLRLLRVKNLRVNEAALTGESIPVEKGVAPVPPSAPIGDRLCMAYCGTVVAFGQGRGVTVATGAATEIGRIGALVAGVDSLSTPLTRRLDQFARHVTAFILAVGVLTFLYGHYVQKMPFLEIFLAVVGLAVAAIPEGLPAIVTITLAIGTGIMARQRAIVRRLPAVETLGSVGVICSDKTGTLTQNEMTAVRLMLAGRSITVSGAGYAPEGGFHDGEQTLDPRLDDELQRLARCVLLCNDARLHHDQADGWTLAGDPTEGALLSLALKAGLDPDAQAADNPRVDEIPFESEHRFMATLHHDHERRVFVQLKGAPERVLDLCLQDCRGGPIEREAWIRRIERAASAGLRVLALAECDMPAETTALAMEDMRPRFTLLGLVGMIDPPRPDAIAAVADCRRAGIRVVMITGDHAITAGAIGAELGLNTDQPLTGELVERLDDVELGQRINATDIVARASPEHKLRLV